jgi:hypothetical protein
MFLTDKLIAAQREASRQVAEGKVYSIELPMVGRVPVPSPRQLALYAALAGLAAVELIDWPVALAMGVGSAVVSRQLGDVAAKEQELAVTIEQEIAASHGEGTAAPAKAATAVQKAPAQKVPAEKVAAKKTPAKQAPANKVPAEKVPAKKVPAKKVPAKKVPEKRTSPRAKA